MGVVVVCVILYNKFEGLLRESISRDRCQEFVYIILYIFESLCSRDRFRKIKIFKKIK